MSWFDPEKREAAALAASQQGVSVAGITDAIVVEVTKGEPKEDSESSRDGT